MPTPSSQDFQSSVDFTVVPTFTGSIGNTALSSLFPVAFIADDQEGVALVLTTVDTAAGVPNVPSPLITPKWKRYLWNRIPFAGSIDTRPTIYAWNNTAVSAPTYLKWNSTREDTTPLYTAIASLTTGLAAASSNASVALTNSNNALSQVAAANANIVIALSNSAAAQASATTANVNATTALSTANGANTTAVAASAIANNAIALAAGNKLVTQITPGLAGQQIRVKADASANEYFSRINTIAIIQNQQANGVAAENIPNAALTDRTLNTTISDTGAIAVLAANQITLAAGFYRVTGRFPLAIGAGVAGYYSILYNVTDAAVVSQSQNGNSIAAGTTHTEFNVIDAVFTIATSKVFKFQTYQSSGAIKTGGTPLSFGLTEIYSSVTIEKLG